MAGSNCGSLSRCTPTPWTFILRLIVVLACPPYQASAEYRIVDVGHAGNTSGQWPGCGNSAETACTSLQYAVDTARSNSSDVLTIYLVNLRPSGSVITSNQSLFGASNLVITAASTLSLQFTEHEVFLNIYNSSNITLSGLSFDLSASAGVAVKIVRSRVILVHRFQCSGIAKNAHGLVVDDSSAVLIRNGYFTGRTPLAPSPRLSESYLSAALIITYRSAAQPVARGKFPGFDWDALNGSSVAVVESQVVACGFQSIGGIYYRRFPAEQEVGQSTAIHLHFHTGATGRTVRLTDCNIDNNTSPYDPAMSVVFEDGARSNGVVIAGCRYSRNSGYIGGAMFVRYNNEGGNTVTVSSSATRQCLFTGNNATLEAAAARVAFSGTLRDSTGLYSDKFSMSGCVVSNSVTGFVLTTMPGTIVVTTQHETASQLYGGLRYQVELSRCSFVGNSAQSGSGMYLQLTSMKVDNCNFTSNTGSAIAAASSLIQLEGTTVFDGNTATIGGALSLVHESVVRVGQNATVLFTGNKATQLGGAVYADIQSSTRTMVETMETSWDIGSSQKQCFLQMPADTSVRYSATGFQHVNGTKLLFYGNFAPVGTDVYAPSIIPCAGAPFLPNVTADINGTAGELGARLSAAGGALWVFFRSASCDCIKPFLNGTMIVYQHGCARDQVAKDIASFGLNSTRSDEFKLVFLKLLSDMFGRDAYVLPDVELLVVPWASAFVYWYAPRSPPFTTELNQTTTIGAPFNLTAEELEYTYSSNITLYPAPGEEFSLAIDVLDYQLGLFSTDVSLRVFSTNSDVLLRYAGLQYGNGGYALFQSLLPLRGMALAGAPGSEGLLLLEMQGQITGLEFSMAIPFRLRPCHAGFELSDLMKNRSAVKEYVANFTVSKPIPSRHEADADNVQALICQCSTASHPAIQQCSDNGYNVTIKAHFWAGDPEGGSSVTSTRLSVIDSFAIYDESLANRTANFASGYCWDQFCSYENSLEAWPLHGTDPCLAGLHRDGALCSLCAEGFSRIPFDNYHCYKTCDDPAAGSTKFYIVSFCACFLVIVLFILFSIGAGATFDTWLLHWQLCTFIDARSNGILLSVLISKASATEFCISQYLSAPGQVATQLIVPLYMVVIVLTLFRAFRVFKIGRRLVDYFPVVKTMWGCFVWGYSYLMFISFQLLSCVPFQGRSTFYLDATVECFGPGHAPLAVLALLTLFLFEVPVPLLLYKYRSAPKVKPFIDPYMSVLKDDRRWWVSANFARRFVFISLAVFITEALPRKIVLFAALQALFLLHAVVQPFAAKLDNAFEAVVLANVIVYSALGAADESETTRTMQLVSFLWPCVAAILLSVYKDRATVRRVYLAVRDYCFPALAEERRSAKEAAEDEAASSASLEEPLLNGDDPDDVGMVNMTVSYDASCEDVVLGNATTATSRSTNSTSL